MNVYATQHNTWMNGSLISGVTSASTGSVMVFKGMKNFSISLESLNDTQGQKGSATGIVQANLSDFQTSWITLFSTGFNNVNTSILFQAPQQPFNAFRIIISPYASGTFNCWFAAMEA